MRVLVMTDIQGNLIALEAALSTAAAKEADTVVCLGDVASGPRPHETIERLRSLEATVVRGNMDDAIAGDAAQARSTTAATASDDDHRFADIDAWCRRQLTEADRAWLRDLPLTRMVDLGHGRSLLACHGSPRSNEDVIDVATSDREVGDLLGNRRADVVAVGHMHSPMLRYVGERMIVHPGSIGWPAPERGNVRRPRAAFAVVVSEAARLDIRFCRVEYDAAKLRRDLDACDMPHANWYARHWSDA